jgi:hypothetical protein
MPSTKVLVAAVYHGGYGHTTQKAEAGHSAPTTRDESLNRHGFISRAAAQSDAGLGVEEVARLADLRTSGHWGAASHRSRIGLPLAGQRRAAPLECRPAPVA